MCLRRASDFHAESRLIYCATHSCIAVWYLKKGEVAQVIDLSRLYLPRHLKRVKVNKQQTDLVQELIDEELETVIDQVSAEALGNIEISPNSLVLKYDN